MSEITEYSITSPIAIGDDVMSEFEVLPGFEYADTDFQHQHIGIAAQFDMDGLQENTQLVRYWRALGFKEDAIWVPGKEMSGSDIIGVIANYAQLTYVDRGLLSRGEVHMLYGDVVAFDGVITERPGQPPSPYQDDLPHIDYAPPEIPSASFFAPSNGGTDSWRGVFPYLGTTQPTYKECFMREPDHDLQPGEFIFTRDGRTYVHGRSPGISNANRVLTRIFMGPGDIDISQ